MIEQLTSNQALKIIYQNDLFALARTGLGYKEITKNTHDPIIKILESESKKKIIVVPRGCFKSTLCSISYPIWLLIRNPNERILLDSELYTNSSKFLREIKGHLGSQHMIELFGEFQTDNNWNESEITIKQRTKVYKESSITCSGIGAQKTSQHYSTIIADDMNSLDNSMTSELREKVINHYRLYISLLEPGGTLVIVGTRYAMGDLIGHIIDNEMNIKNEGLI
jgi:hypothetical protein